MFCTKCPKINVLFIYFFIELVQKSTAENDACNLRVLCCKFFYATFLWLVLTRVFKQHCLPKQYFFEKFVFQLFRSLWSLQQTKGTLHSLVPKMQNTWQNNISFTLLTFILLHFITIIKKKQVATSIPPYIKVR